MIMLKLTTKFLFLPVVTKLKKISQGLIDFNFIFAVKVNYNLEVVTK